MNYIEIQPPNSIEVQKNSHEALGPLLQLGYFPDFYIKIWYFKNYCCPCCVWIALLSWFAVCRQEEILGFIHKGLLFAFMLFSNLSSEPPESSSVLLLGWRMKDWARVLSRKRRDRGKAPVMADVLLWCHKGAKGEAGAKHIASGIPSLPCNYSKQHSTSFQVAVSAICTISSSPRIWSSNGL